MSNVYLLTGSNVGSRLDNLHKAELYIEKRIGVIFKRSGIYETAAWGIKNQDSFLNQVLLIKTGISAGDLLIKLKDIEQQVGRKTSEKWGPRVIDIDILFLDDLIIESDLLTIPHKEIENRKFTLEPLAEIAPNLVHPVSQITVKQLLAQCSDNLPVSRVQLTHEV